MNIGSKRQRNTLARLLTLGGMSWFILWACAPMMSAPPSPPMPPLTEHESGHGAMGGMILNQHRSAIPMPIGGYQYWYRKPTGLNNRDEVGAIAQLGWPGLGGGGYYRKALIKNETAYLGLQGAAGFIWLQASIPAAIKVGEKSWLTTQPSLKMQMLADLHIPVGMSWELGEKGRLDTEIGMHSISTRLEDGYPPVAENFRRMHNWGPYIGLGYSRRLGKSVPASQSPTSEGSPKLSN